MVVTMKRYMSSASSKVVSYTLASIAMFFIGTVAHAAASGSGIGAIATNITTNLGAIARLVTAGSYVAGLAFAIGAILKFKAHKDNPTQIPVGTPIALLFIAAALIFMPSIFKASGYTLFSKGGTAAGITGITSFKNI